MKSRFYPATAIAKYVLAHDTPMTNKRLQSMLYQIQAAYFINLGREIFKDDILACSGTVKVPAVWSEYASNGDDQIQCNDDPESYSMISDSDKKRLSHLINLMSGFNEARLYNIIERGEPFNNAIKQGENTPISLDDMKKKFYRGE